MKSGAHFWITFHWGNLWGSTTGDGIEMEKGECVHPQGSGLGGLDSCLQQCLKGDPSWQPCPESGVRFGQGASLANQPDLYPQVVGYICCGAHSMALPGQGHKPPVCMLKTGDIYESLCSQIRRIIIKNVHTTQSHL